MARKMLVLVWFACWLAFSVFITGSSEAFEPESILGVWLFDEGKGNELIDSSEKGHNGAIMGADVKRVDGSLAMLWNSSAAAKPKFHTPMSSLRPPLHSWPGLKWISLTTNGS